MCLSDTEKGFQTQKRLNNPSFIEASKWRDRNKFPQAGQIAINGDWNRRKGMEYRVNMTMENKSKKRKKRLRNMVLMGVSILLFVKYFQRKGRKEEG